MIDPITTATSSLAAQLAAKTLAGSALSSGQASCLFCFGGWHLGLGFDGYLDVSSFLELHLIAMLVD